MALGGRAFRAERTPTVLKPILILVASLFLGTCAQAGVLPDSALVRSDSSVGEVGDDKTVLVSRGNAQVQIESASMPLPTPAPKVVVHPKPEGAAKPVTKITVPPHMRTSLVEVEAYIGNDQHGYWPIDEMGNVSMSGWKSSITGGVA